MRRKNIQSGKSGSFVIYVIFGSIFLTLEYVVIDDLDEVLKDVRNSGYRVQEVDLDQLKRRKKRGRGIGIIYTLGHADMDVYQYRKLKEMKENFTLSVDNFDYYVKPAKTYRYYTPSPPMTEEDKRKILDKWNISSDKERKQLMEQLDMKVEIKLKVYSLPRSRKMLKYEFLEPVGTIKK